MGGFGAPIIFGGVWAGTMAAVVFIGNAWKQWNGQKALVRIGDCSPQTVLGVLDQAAMKVVFGTMAVAAFAVYHVKRWQLRRQDGRSRGD